MSLSHRSSRMAFAALTLAGVAVGAAHADPKPTLSLRTDLSAGFIQGAWQPVTVRIDNPADAAPIDGIVRVRLRDERIGVTYGAVEVPVRVPSGATGAARLTVYVPFDGFPTAQVTVLQGTGERAAMVATARLDNVPTEPPSIRFLTVGAARGVDREKVTLTLPNTGVRRDFRGTLRAGVDRTPSTKATDTMGGRSGDSQPIRLQMVTAEELPTRGAGYDGVAAVYLAPDAGPMDGARLHALRAFVRRGGIVLDHSGSELRSEGWGIVVDGSAFSDKDLRALLRSRIGMNRLGAELDISAAWTDIETYGQDALTTEVLRGQGLQAPPVGLLLGFLAVYLLLAVPGQYLILKRLDRREWAWFVTPALAIGFSAAAYGYARQGRVDRVFHNTVAFAEMSAGSGEATVTGAVGVYSPRTATYDIAVDLPDTVLWRGASGETLHAPEQAVARQVAIGQWAMRAVRFRTDGVRLGDGVTITETDGGSVRVENHTGRVIEGAVLASGAQYTPLGDLAPGVAMRVRMSHREDVWNGPTHWPYRGPDRSQVHESLVMGAQSRSKIRSEAKVSEPGIVLMGRIRGAVAPVRVLGADSQARETVTHLLVRMPTATR